VKLSINDVPTRTPTTRVPSPLNRMSPGVDLAIAQGLLEAQGGRIWAENRPEGGARVAFTLQPA
jgi:signal transduction histidine kinase